MSLVLTEFRRSLVSVPIERSNHVESLWKIIPDPELGKIIDKGVFKTIRSCRYHLKKDEDEKVIVERLFFISEQELTIFS